MRRRPNQEMPNQILDSQASSKYVENINNKIEREHVYAEDYDWFYEKFKKLQETLNTKFGDCACYIKHCP